MLQPFGPDVWFHDYDLFLPGGIHFPGRMTVVRLPGEGELWLHSPIPIDDDLAHELDALGPVRHIVAPNKVHHLHVPAAMARYPEARVWGAPGLYKKRKDIAFTDKLTADAPQFWSSVLEQHVVGGAPWVNEVVFFHRPSTTLIVTDLVFNVYECKGLLSPLVFRMAGAYRRLAQSRLLRRSVKDRAAFANSGRTVLTWDFDRVLMAHGRPLAPFEGQPSPKDQLCKALAWMLEGG